MSMEQNRGKLPEMCYAYHKYSQSIIAIRRGETGYYQTGCSSLSPEEGQALADELNQKLGVTKAQAQAMSVGSMFGWHVPGADPAVYEAQEQGKAEQPDPVWDERAYSLNNGEHYLYIQTCDDGYDYTIYNKDFSEMDGGQLDEPELSMDEATEAILEAFELQNVSRDDYDTDELTAATDAVAQEQLAAARSRMSARPLDERISSAQERAGAKHPAEERENERT